MRCGCGGCGFSGFRSQRSQLVVASHATALVSKLAGAGDARQIVLAKQLGETLVPGDERPAWAWPTR
jgi:hypothetical protein